MARQKGPILLTGQVDNLSYYKMNGKHFVRRKSGVSRDRLMSDAVYERTRENIAIFGQASLAAKLLRGCAARAVCPILQIGYIVGLYSFPSQPQ